MTDTSALLSPRVDAVRSALLVVICVLAIAGTVLFFGADRPPLTPDEEAIRGHWSADAIDLELGDAGRYALVVGTAGRVECGKWRVEGGSLQMRAKSGGAPGTTLLMTQPGFRAGSYQRHGERLDLHLQTALPGERSRPESWALAQAEGALLERCP